MVRVGLTFLTLGSLVAASVWVLLTPPAVANDSNDINVFMNKAYTTELTMDGTISSMVYAPQIIHHKSTQYTDFTKPDILTYASDRTPWLTRSLYGKSLNDNQIDLWGDVHFHQLPYLAHVDTLIDTDQMTLYPHRSYATTARPLTLTRQDMTIHAVGVHAYLNRGEYQLLSQPHGSFHLTQNPQQHNGHSHRN